MDWLTFVTKIIEALSWPVALIFSVLLIRRPLLSAMPFLRKLKYSDVEVEFSQEISSLRKGVSEVKADGKNLVVSKSLIPEHVLKVAGISPRAAVVEAWKEVENAITELAQRNLESIKNWDGESILSLVEALEKNGKIDRKVAELVRRQKAITDRFTWRAAEDASVNPDEAMEVADLHISLASHLRREITNSPNLKPYP